MDGIRERVRAREGEKERDRESDTDRERETESNRDRERDIASPIIFIPSPDQKTSTYERDFSQYNPPLKRARQLRIPQPLGPPSS